MPVCSFFLASYLLLSTDRQFILGKKTKKCVLFLAETSFPPQPLLVAQISPLETPGSCLVSGVCAAPFVRSVGVLFFLNRNETRRVVVVLLTEYPEAESLLFAGLMKLNVIVQSTIAVAMIIGLLACLCMCRMMFLLKSR